MKRLLIVLSFGFFTLSLPLSAFAYTAIDTTEVLAEPVPLFSDVDLPSMPHRADFSSEAEFLAAKENYYQAFGTLMFTFQIENAFDKLKGYEASDGSRYFATNNSVNRAEAAKFFQAYSHLNDIDVNEGVVSFSTMFEDEIPTWAEEYVYILKDQGIVKGYSDGTYRPNNTMNNAEIFKFLYKTYLNGDVDESSSPWYQGYEEALVQAKIIPEGLDPDAAPTRGEMASYMMRGYIMEQTEAEAFSDYRTALFIEDLMFYSWSDDLAGLIYSPGDLQFYTLVVEEENEYIELQNQGSSSMDLSGYTLRLADQKYLLEYEYVFPEGTELEADATLSVYTQEGVHSFEAETDSGYGILDDIYGTYRYMLYNSDYELIDFLAFQVP